MELSALAEARLIVGMVVLAFVAFWGVGAVGDRRRQARFAALAQSFGCEVVREGEFLSRFPVAIDGRMFDVRLQHIGKRGWYVVTEVALQGVSELHSAEIRPRMRRSRKIDPRSSVADFEEHFNVHDAGFPLREGWRSQGVRSAIAHFYELEPPLAPLSIEEGRLVHRWGLPVRRLSGPLLREVLTRQRAVADALERSL